MVRSISVAATALAASPALASVLVQLNTGAMPSTQPGWRYEASANDAGTPETRIFSTDGTILTSNTMGLPFGSGRPGSMFAVYDLAPGVIQSDSIVEMRLNARIVASQVTQFFYGFSVSVYGDGLGMSAGFATNALSLDALQNIFRDNTDWNEFVWRGDWNAGTYTLHINGELIATRNLRAFNANYITLGDGTGTANAHAEISHFSVRIIPAPAAPSALALAGLAATRRRR